MNVKMISVFALSAIVWTQPALAGSAKAQNIGVGTGAIVGAVVGGPVGFFVGVIGGAKIGEKIDHQSDQNFALNSELEQARSAQSDLSRQVSVMDAELVATRESLDAIAEGPMADAYAVLRNGLDIDVLFGTDEYEIDARMTAQLQRLATSLTDLDGVRIHLDGYADSRGSGRYNEMLSLQRAQHVREIIAAAGVDARLITLKAHGSELTAESEAPRATLQSQRRVAIRISLQDELADRQLAGL